VSIRPPAARPQTQPAQVVPATPPTMRFRLKLQTSTGAVAPFANRFYQIHWGDAILEGRVNAAGEISEDDVDIGLDEAVLHVGEYDAAQSFVAQITIPLRRFDAPLGALPAYSRTRTELYWRLHNLGFAMGPFDERGDLYGALRSAIQEWVFRHHIAGPTAERGRYGDWRDAADEMLGGRRPIDTLLADVIAAHDGPTGAGRR
jgi:hypothetical protein